MQLKMLLDLLEIYRGSTADLLHFALRVVLAGRLARASLCRHPRKFRNILEIFSAVLGCREVSAGWKTDSRSSCEGCRKHLWTPFGLFETKFWKSLEGNCRKICGSG